MAKGTLKHNKFFGTMEQKRFKDLEDIKAFLQKEFIGATISAEFKSYEDADYFCSDYEIICTIQQKDFDYLIDLDLYFLYDRKNMLLITEFGFEEE